MFLESLFIRSDHLHRRRKDFFAAAIIHIQGYDFCSRIVFGKIQHDLRSCASEMIDRLVIISHNKKIILRFCKKLYDIILQLVDVLKLIDKNILEFILPCRQNILTLIKQLITIKDHIIKIQLSSCLTDFDIFPVYLTKNFVRATGRIIIFQRNPVSLDNADLLRDFFREISFLCQISTIIHGKFPENRYFFLFCQNICGSKTICLFQDTIKNAMEGSKCNWSIFLTGKIQKTLFHFFCRRSGKGYNQNISRRNSAFLCHICSSFYYYGGFPRTGACQDHHRS